MNSQAVVQLPSYFESLTHTEDRTVQLTCKNARSRGEVANGQFVVRTTAAGSANQEFPWEVKAVRSDVSRLKVEMPREEFPRAVQPEDFEDVSYQHAPVAGSASSSPAVVGEVERN